MDSQTVASSSEWNFRVFCSWAVTAFVSHLKRKSESTNQLAGAKPFFYMEASLFILFILSTYLERSKIDPTVILISPSSLAQF